MGQGEGLGKAEPKGSMSRRRVALSTCSTLSLTSTGWRTAAALGRPPVPATWPAARAARSSRNGRVADQAARLQQVVGLEHRRRADAAAGAGLRTEAAGRRPAAGRQDRAGDFLGQLLIAFHGGSARAACKRMGSVGHADRAHDQAHGPSRHAQRGARAAQISASHSSRLRREGASWRRSCRIDIACDTPRPRAPCRGTRSRTRPCASG